MGRPTSEHLDVAAGGVEADSDVAGRLLKLMVSGVMMEVRDVLRFDPDVPTSSRTK